MAAEEIADDLIQPFRIEAFSLRGRLVRLGPAIDEVLGGHDYPAEVATLLGETVTLAVLLAAALKYDGIFKLQVQGDGPVGLIVADVTSAHELRGYAQFDAERLAALSESSPADNPVPRLLGAGHLGFSVDQGADTERYQGIVELTGATMAECAHHYFRQSEQVEAAIHIACGLVAHAGTGGWRAGGMMVQRLPTEGGHEPEKGAEFRLDEDAEDGWRRALALMAGVSGPELLAPEIAPHDLLYRLFHEDGVRVYRTAALAMRCRCSLARVQGMLGAMPRAEVEAMKHDGEVVVTCQFCAAVYRYDDAALDRLYAGS